MMFNLEEILKATDAEVIKNDLVSEADMQTLFGVSTDTRKIREGEIYLPLKGETFDGEDFLEKAVECGAVGCFITREEYPEQSKLVLKVKNTLEAYLKLANFRRHKLNPKTIAVTGSSGKTTTKELIYSVMKEKFKTHKTFSNHNNEIGFCETVMTMPEDCEVLIVEMGMRGLGEIELLSKYAEPDFAVITNAGSAHIGRLGSLDNIAKAKSEIVSHLKPCGTFISQNSERIKKFADFSGEKIFYELADAEIIERAKSYTRFLYKGKKYELNIEGDFNVENSMAAIEAGYKLGMSYEEIRTGLASYKPIEKRWEAEEVGGFKIINDSYNANPESMKASVSTFINLYETPCVILGDMGELGYYTEDLHRGVGEFLAGLKNSSSVTFLTVGKYAEKIGEPLKAVGANVKNFENNSEVSEFILDNTPLGTTIFLKASRSMKFEEIIKNIKGEVKL